MKIVPFGKLNKNNSVFLMIKSKYTLPKIYKEHFGKEIDIFLMQLRWDGKFGFPGGFVDNNESLVEALKRECLEEINFEVKEDNLIEECSIDFEEKELTSHLYSIDVDINVLKQIIKNSIESKDFIAENSGSTIISFEDYYGKGFNVFLENQFATSVKEELLFLFNKYKSIT